MPLPTQRDFDITSKAITGWLERAEEGAWLVLATKILVPEPSALDAARRDLGSIAARHGGEYDGWGTPVP